MNKSPYKNIVKMRSKPTFLPVITRGVMACPPSPKYVDLFYNYYLDLNSLVSKLEVVAKDRLDYEAKQARFNVVVSESCSFAAVAKRNALPSGGHSFVGTIPTIVISSPQEVAKEIRVARRATKAAAVRTAAAKARLKRRRADRRLAQQEALRRRLNEESPYVKAFYKQVEEGFIPQPKSFKHFERLISQFKNWWMLQHNTRKSRVSALEKKKERRYPFTYLEPRGHFEKRDVQEPPRKAFPPPPPQGKMPKIKASRPFPTPESQLWPEGVFVAGFVEEKQRSIILLVKLRMQIRELRAIRARRTRALLFELQNLLKKKAQTVVEFPEMDTGKEGEQIKCVPASNVTLQTHTEESTVKLKPNRGKLKKVAGGDKFESYDHLTDRWFELGVAEWKADDGVNTQLFDKVLPVDLVSANKTSSNFLPFLCHQYMTFDNMVIRAQINATPYQIGAAQMSWYYCHEEDVHYGERAEVANCSQLPHAVLDVSVSNDAVLTIPYKHYQTFISLTSRSDVAPALALGKFRMLVLNNLKASTGTSSTCNVTVYVKFEGVKLMGMTDTGLSGTYTNGEMMPALAFGAAHALLHSVDADYNRDRPPYQRARVPVVPAASQSLCLGDHLDQPLNSMRLDSRGQTPHPEFSGLDEMKVNNIAGRYMLVNRVDWKTDDAQSTRLASFDAAAMMELSSYWNIDKEGKKIYDFPPVAVLASCFGGYRGRLDFKFEFVCSKFHSGRLLFVYVPHNLTAPTKAQSKSSANVTFDLGTQRQFVFTTPYMSNRPFWPHRLSTGVDSDEFDPPGKFHIFVQNQLRAASNMPNNIQINVYVKANEDFEFAYPCQPSIGLSWDMAHFNPNKYYVSAKTGYYPYYMSFWKHAMIGDQYLMTFGCGSGANDISQFIGSEQTPLVWGNMYQFEDKNYWKNNLYAKCLVLGKEELFDDVVFIPFYSYYSATLTYLVAYPNIAAVRMDIFKGGKLIPSNQCLFKNAIYWVEDTKYGKGNPSMTFTRVTPNNFDTDSESSYDFGSDIGTQTDEVPEVGDERFTASTSSCLEVPPPSTTNSGSLLWGEKFDDLKTLVRRYQLYTNISVKLRSTTGGDLLMVANFPVLPQGITSDYRHDPAASTRREGLIPIIASGYRFYRGSIDLKFIFSVPSSSNCVFYIQHRPDRPCLNTRVNVSSRSDMDAYFVHGYATVYVDPSINKQVTINVPYYQLGNYGLLQTPNCDLDKTNRSKNGHFSLGQIYVFVDTCAKIEVGMRVFYAMGDDMRFEEFVGFPRMCLVRDFEKQTPEEPEMGGSELFRSKSESDLNYETPDMLTGPGHIPRDDPKHEAWQVNLMKYLTDPILNELRNAVKDFRKNVNVNIDILTMINNVATNLAHLSLSPSVGHLAIMVVSLLVQIGILSIDSIQKAVKAFNDMLTRYCEANQRPEAPGDDNTCAEVSALLFAGVATMVGLKDSLPRESMFDTTKSLIKIFSSIGRSHNGILSLFKTMISIVSNIVDKVLKYVNRDQLAKWYLSNTPEIVKKYYNEAIELLNPSFEELLLTDSKQYARLDACVYVGSMLLRDLTVGDRKVNVVATLMQTQARLTLLRDKAHKNNISINKRREPYCLHFTGKPGIGKSQLCTDMVDFLFEEHNIKQSGPCIFEFTSGSKHWDGYVNQLVVTIDDLRCFRDPQAEIDEFSCIFKLKSCSPFRPPMAHLDDKGRFCTPEMLLINSNIPYPSSNALSDQSALYRRYDDLIQVMLRPDLFKKFSNISDLNNLEAVKSMGIDLSKMEHLCFRAKITPSESDGPYSDIMTWEELKVYISKRFKLFRDHQFSIQKRHCLTESLHGLDADKAVKKFLNNLGQSQPIFDLYKSCFKRFFGMDNLAHLSLEEEQVSEAFEMNRCDVYVQQLESNPMNIVSPRVENPVFVADNLEHDEELLVTRTTHNIKLSYTECIKYIRRLQKRTESKLLCLKSENLKVIEEKFTSCPHKYDTLINCCYYFDCDKFVNMITAEEYPTACANVTSCTLSNKVYRERLKLTLIGEPSWFMTFRAYPELMESGLPACSKKAPFKIMAADKFEEELTTMITTLAADGYVKKLSTLKKFLLCVVMPLSMLYTGYSFLSKVKDTVVPRRKTPAELVYHSNKNKRLDPEIIPSGDNKTIRAQSHARGLSRRMPETVQGNFEFAEISTSSALTAIVRRNTFFLNFVGEHSVTKEHLRTGARCLGVCGHYAVIPRHYIVFYLSLNVATRKCTYYLDADGIEVKLDKLNRWDIEEDEISIVEMPKRFPLFRDIRSQFMTYDRLNKTLPREAWFCETSPDRLTELVSINIAPKNDVTVRVDGVDVFISQAIGYGYHGRGRCGSVVLTGADGGRIIGMHISGREGSGTSSYLYRDMFDCLPANQPQVNQFDHQIAAYTDNQCKPNKNVNGTFIDLGVVDKALEHNQSGVSSISKNLLDGIFEPTTDIAILSKHHKLAFGVDPLECGINKQGQPTTNIPDEFMELAVDDLRTDIFSRVVPLTHVVRPLTMLEACNGVRDLNLKKIELSTSEGFPLIAGRPADATNKKWLFECDSDNKIIGIHKDLAKMIVREIKQREQLEVQAIVFTNCLKDARLPLHKIKPEKTRTFSVAPLNFTIVCRMYFSAFFQAWEKSRLEHSVGMAVQKREWTDLGKEMSAFSDCHLTGDYTNYGDSLDAEAVDHAYDIVIEWLYINELKFLPKSQCDLNRNVRICIKYETKNAIRLCGNMLLQPYCGSPSGHPHTVDINSIIGCIYIRVCWLKVFENIPHMLPLDRLHKYALWRVYGDDVWISVAREVVRWFNNKTMSIAFASMGIIYTDATKSGEIREMVSFDEVTFLKHRFLPHPTRKGNFLAALDKGSVTDCAIWSKNMKDNKVESTLESAYACLMLAYGWGPEYYNEIKGKLAVGCQERGINFKPRTWKQLDDMFYICDEYEHLNNELYVDYSNPIELYKMYETMNARNET